MTRDRVPRVLRDLVRARAGDRCEYCLLPQWSQDATFHIDHVRPRFRGGKTSLGNLALSCIGCSLYKSAKLLAKDPQTGINAKLFNPRRDEWMDHFRWTADWQVEGRTSTGRATIDALRLNRVKLVRIRVMLVSRGQFPPFSDRSMQ